VLFSSDVQRHAHEEHQEEDSVDDREDSAPPGSRRSVLPEAGASTTRHAGNRVKETRQCCRPDDFDRRDRRPTALLGRHVRDAKTISVRFQRVGGPESTVPEDPKAVTQVITVAAI